MKWEQRELGLALPGVISAVVTDVPQGWAARVFMPKEDRMCVTEQEAKEWAEARMNELKKEFILSLIVEEKGWWKLGCIAEIIPISTTEFSVFLRDVYEFKGTLEECKNYIASCF